MQKQEEKPCKSNCLKYESRTQEVKPTDGAEAERSREIGKAEGAVAGEDDGLLAVRARPLGLPEGAGDAGGAGRGADAPVALRGGSRPVGPVAHAAGRMEALGGGGLGREDGGQAPEVGLVCVVGLVYSAHAVEGRRRGDRRRGGEEDEEEQGMKMMHGGWLVAGGERAGSRTCTKSGEDAAIQYKSTSAARGRRL